nr:retrotransposon protein, putative, unclassified [Tanacetum cinerariifolium]
MESLSPQVVAAAKLPILNPNKFNLWKMRIEQYFLISDYSLWEVILNGNSPTPIRVVDGVVQLVAPTTAEQRLAKKNKLKARGTLLIAFPDKHQLKFNIHKDAKSLMEAIEKRFGGNKETKKIYEAEVKSSSFTIHTTQNIAFVSSHNTDITNESVRVVASVFAASTKPSTSILPNVMDLKWQMAMLTMRAKRRGHFARECRSARDTRNKDTQRRNVSVETSTSNALVSQCDGFGSYNWSLQADKEPTNYALMAFTSSSSTSSLGSDSLEFVEARLVVYQQNENMFEEDIKLLKLDVMLRENALVELRKKFKKAKQERVELKLTLENFQTSSNNLNVSMPTSLVHDRYKSREGYHAVPPPYTGTFMPLKPDLVFHDAPTASETVPTVLNVKPSTPKPNKDLSQLNRPSVPIIEDLFFNSKDESGGEPMPTQKAASFVETSEHVKTPRLSGNPQQALKDKSVINSGRSRHMNGNISYLSNFKEINRGYVAFGGNPKGGKITCKDPLGKFDGKAYEGFLVGYSVSSKAYRVFNSRTRTVQETSHINFLENQPNVSGSGPTWLFDIDTLTQSMNYQPVVAGNQPNSSAGRQDNFDAGKVGKEPVTTQQYVLLPLWSTGSKNPQNKVANVAFDDKEPYTNGVNATSTLVTDVGLNLTNSSFSAASPSNTTISPTLEVGRKSSCVDPSQYPDDPNMPALEDITYLDDEEDVEEPKRVLQALKDPSWIEAMQEELLQLKMQKVWVLVDLPKGKRAIGSKWVFRNKTDERGIVIRNKARLVGQGHTQEEALKAWYETLANYLLENGFQKGKIDQTLFIKKQKYDILLVQVYVDDIIFGSTNQELCKAFEKLMKDKFQMISMGELTFFLGLQIKQMEDGIFISQDKYVAEILRKFGLTNGKSASTPIDTKKPLLKDPNGEDVDVHIYRSMIGSLMYLTSSRPDIMFAVYAYAHFQVTLKVSHLHTVKRIFRFP